MDPLMTSVVAGLVVAALLALGRIFRSSLSRGLRKFFLKIAIGKLGPVEIIEPSTKTDSLLRRELESSKSARILQVRGHDLLTRKSDAILKNNLRKRTENQLNTQLLLLNPHSNAAYERAKQIGLAPMSFKRGIQATIEEVENLREQNIGLNLRLYNSRPIFSLAVFDEYLILSFYALDGDRQDMPAVVIRSKSILHDAFSAYFDSMWADHSLAVEELSYHFEIEIKAKILDHEAAIHCLEQMGAHMKGTRRYRDHYFTPLEGAYAEDSGIELRVRCDLLRERMFLTEKRPFSADMEGSKMELETYVGSISEAKEFCKNIVERGYREYSSFHKESDFYTLHHGTFHFNIVLSSVRKTEDDMVAMAGRAREFVEIEVIQPESTNEEIIKHAHRACADVLSKFEGSVSSVTSKTYSSMFASEGA